MNPIGALIDPGDKCGNVEGGRDNASPGFEPSVQRDESGYPVRLSIVLIN